MTSVAYEACLAHSVSTILVRRRPAGKGGVELSFDIFLIRRSCRARPNIDNSSIFRPYMNRVNGVAQLSDI